MNINYCKSEGSVKFINNPELCDYMEKTLSIQVLPQESPVGHTLDGDVFTVKKHLLATISTKAITDMQEIHQIDGKKEVILASLSDFKFRTNQFGTPFNTMYAREIYFKDETDDSGDAVTEIILRADLR